LAGGINIAYDTKRPYSYFSQEQVIKRNPDCIILAYMGKESPLKVISERFGWNNISAVKNNRIYNDINPDSFLRPGPRLVEALREIHKRLYP
jgi:iron complex transport system substrate-binding protein